jgi:hypothetical protein
MSGQWPPEWDDQDDNIPGEADQQDAEVEAGLSEVAAYLASVPAPLMPGSVEARISAALAVEAASRGGITAPADGTVKAQETAGAQEATGPRVLGPVPPAQARARARVRAQVRRRGERGQHGGRGNRRPLGQLVLGPLAVCLLLVLIGFGLSRVGRSSSSSSSANSVAGAPAATSAAAAGTGTRYGAAVGSATSAPQAAASSAPSAASTATGRTAVPAAAGTSASFVVSATGTRYQQATLAQQAQAQRLAAQARGAVSSAAPAASSPSSAVPSPSGAVRTYAASPQLRACVLKVTGGALPELVDRATYQGTPVYVIASSSRVWVVGLGCTAATPQVITSVPLAG